MFNKIKIRKNLTKRRCMVSWECIMCGCFEKTIQHLFLECTTTWKI